jgi:peptidoglycan/LPS O-acetylase OafA/YrhL
MKKMFNIQALRGIVTLLVCCNHLFLFQNKYFLECPELLYFLQNKLILYILTLFFLLPFFFIFYQTQSSTYIESGLFFEGWNRILFFGLPSIFSVSLSLSAENSSLLFNKYLDKIGDYSYSIYLSHKLVIHSILKVSNIFINNSSYLITLFIIFLKTIFIIFWGRISYSYIERPLIKFTKSLYSKLFYYFIM